MFLFLLSRTHTWLHTSFLFDPETSPHVFFLPHPLKIPPLVSVEHCLSFELSFVISSLNFFLSFLSLVSCPTPASPTFSSIFFFILFSLVFFFLSICSTRTVPPPGLAQLGGNLPVFASVGTTSSAPIIAWRERSPPTWSKSFLSGSSYVWVCRKKKQVGWPRRNGRGFLNMI